MIKDNDSVSKYHYKVYQAEAIKWWRCLSINQQRGLEKKHGAFGQAPWIEIARIYDLESRKDPDLLKNAQAEVADLNRRAKDAEKHTWRCCGETSGFARVFKDGYCLITLEARLSTKDAEEIVAAMNERESLLAIAKMGLIVNRVLVTNSDGGTLKDALKAHFEIDKTIRDLEKAATHLRTLREKV